MKRAVRRAHLRRMKKHAKFVAKVIWRQTDTGNTVQLANNLKSCSCSMCGNPRRNYKGWATKTLQEWKAFEATKCEY